jgi:hypothetical protein
VSLSDCSRSSTLQEGRAGQGQRGNRNARDQHLLGRPACRAALRPGGGGIFGSHDTSCSPALLTAAQVVPPASIQLLPSATAPCGCLARCCLPLRHPLHPHRVMIACMGWEGCMASIAANTSFSCFTISSAGSRKAGQSSLQFRQATDRPAEQAGQAWEP